MPTLKDLRTAAGLSQTELANASGVSLETIKKIETGKVGRPHPATMRLLAAVLGQVPVVMQSSRNGPVFDTGMFDNTRRVEGPCLEIVPDERLRIPSGFVPLRQTTLTGSVEGPLARLTLTQLFSYSRVDCDRVLEAVYRFPLPGDAAVTSVRVRFGNVTVMTNLATRAEAERQYAAARQAGRQAALATRESSDVFTLQLTGLQPDQDVSVETEFVQAAAPEGAGWQLRVPLTIGPRYSRPDESGSAASRGQPLQVWRDPGHRFSLDVLLGHAGAIFSATHDLYVTPEAGAQRVRLADGAVVPDRDLVLAWRPEQLTDRPALDVIAHEDPEEGLRYFLALITPPASPDGWPGVDREVILLVDRSGSMAGPKWEACRWAVRRFLAGLGAADSFNLGLFQNDCQWLAPLALAGTDVNRERALAFVDSHGPAGGTELGQALEQALRSDTAPGARAQHVLLLTDAQVSDEGRILQLVEAEGERPDGRHVSVISIDSAPRSAFVRAIAEASGGEAIFLSSDPHSEDITSGLDRVLETWSRPLATNVELSVETGARSVQARHAAGVTRSKIRLGDLPAGRSLWVSGAVSLYSEPVFRLNAGPDLLAELTLSLDMAPAPCPEVRTLFGARQIARLERLEAQAHDDEERDAILDELGYANDPIRVPRRRFVFAENKSAEATLVRMLLVRESLRYGLVCSATAFVGERLEAGRRVDARVEVPSALPAGWNALSVAAAPAPMMARREPMLRALSGDSPRMHVDRGSFFEKSVRLGRPEQAPPTLILRYAGVPDVTDGRFVLAGGVVGRDIGARLTRLRVSLDGNATDVDERCELWIVVDGSAELLRIGLRELLTLGGERPLNVAVPDGAQVEVVLVVPNRTWPQSAGGLEVELS